MREGKALSVLKKRGISSCMNEKSRITTICYLQEVTVEPNTEKDTKSRPFKAETASKQENTK